MEIELKVKQKIDVKYLGVSVKVRYSEDATVNGVEDTDGELMPLMDGENWEILIDINNGAILDWPKGTTAKVHYKVCDEGRYTLLTELHDLIVALEDAYVPSMLSIGQNGYGDYIILNIDENGFIENFKADLEDFTNVEEAD